ncbi:hypothetical protein POTOM_003604 [Populus tomentosa]|uniref:Uncharacterized protein n=1 Tax=Populus tomentosa TaxID=118781 RepID=A0A8X8ANT3_POPTO|nr:hypothetical protein POTOM_003604 [Populus tomentosa]
METYRCTSTVLHSSYKMRIFTLKIRALILSHMENPRILSLFFLYIKTFSSCMIPFDRSSILYQNAFHKKLRIFPLNSFKWSIFTVYPAFLVSDRGNFVFHVKALLPRGSVMT